MKEIVLGVIPARGGSKGIPRKNLVDLGGTPLVAHAIAQAKGASRLDRFVVSSDDPEIRRVAASYGSEVMDRPDEYAHDQILQEVDLLLQWTVREYEKQHDEVRVDIVVLLYPTAPFREPRDIDAAVALVQEGGHDSALTAFFDTRYLWSKNGVTPVSASPTNYNPSERMPRQKESWNQWAENKAVYVMKREVLESGCRVGRTCGIVEMEKIRSIDIDEPGDLLLAQALLKSGI